MTIRDMGYRERVSRDVEPRLAVAHKDLTVIAGHLRNAGVDIWTESPSDSDKSAGLPHFSLEGWRVHFRGERRRFAQFNVEYGALLMARDPELGEALTGYIDALPAIVSAMASTARSYQDGEGNTIQTKISQSHREALATVIEAELA